MNMDINTVNLNGIATISSALVPQENVKDLRKDLSALATGIEESYNKLDAFKKEQLHFNDCANKDIEDCGRQIRNLMDYNQMLSVEILRIDNNLNDTKNILAGALKSIESLTKEAMIQYFMIILLFIIDLVTIWFYIRK